MQRDTTPASSKVGAPVFKLIVVLAQNHHFPPAHQVRKKPPLSKNHIMKSPSYSYWHFMCVAMKFKGEKARGCWGNYSLFFLTLDSRDALRPFRQDVGKSHIIPSGSGRWHYEFHLVLSVPLPRPCLDSSLTCWRHRPSGNQRQMCTHAEHRSSSRYRKDNLATERQQRMMSSRWHFHSHQMRSNQQWCECEKKTQCWVLWMSFLHSEAIPEIRLSVQIEAERFPFVSTSWLCLPMPTWVSMFTPGWFNQGMISANHWRLFILPGHFHSCTLIGKYLNLGQESNIINYLAGWTIYIPLAAKSQS